MTREYDKGFLMLWRNANAIIVGRNQNTIAEINTEAVKSFGTSVIRRSTGGGAVYHDLGNLNYSIAVPGRQIAHESFADFARPDIGAVFHCHSPYLTAYALAYQDFDPPQNVFLGKLFGKIHCLPYGEHGTHAIHAGIETALDGKLLALLGGHGVVCVGKTLEEAIGTLEAAENFAKTLAIRNTL